MPTLCVLLHVSTNGLKQQGFGLLANQRMLVDFACSPRLSLPASTIISGILTTSWPPMRRPRPWCMMLSIWVLTT